MIFSHLHSICIYLLYLCPCLHFQCFFATLFQMNFIFKLFLIMAMIKNLVSIDILNFILSIMLYVFWIFYLVVIISSLHYIVCQCQIYLYCFLKFDNLEFLLIFKFCLCLSLSVQFSSIQSLTRVESL